VILKGSRYQAAPVYQGIDADGRPFTALGIRLIPATPAGYLHTVVASDRLDLLSFGFYNNPEKFWLIADANSAMDPADLLVPGHLAAVPPDRV
jgi:nucleoid-associated protein YgaU